MQYISVASTASYDIETGTNVQARTQYNARMYPKQIIANQYNFPALIGRELVMFYLVNDSLAFGVKVNDEITYKGSTYKVLKFQEHMAYGDIVLFRISALKS